MCLQHPSICRLCSTFDGIRDTPCVPVRRLIPSTPAQGALPGPPIAGRGGWDKFPETHKSRGTTCRSKNNTTTKGMASPLDGPYNWSLCMCGMHDPPLSTRIAWLCMAGGGALPDPPCATPLPDTPCAEAACCDTVCSRGSAICSRTRRVGGGDVGEGSGVPPPPSLHWQPVVVGCPLTSSRLWIGGILDLSFMILVAEAPPSAADPGGRVAVMGEGVGDGGCNKTKVGGVRGFRPSSSTRRCIGGLVGEVQVSLCIRLGFPPRC
jgi:hypothetical protein